MFSWLSFKVLYKRRACTCKSMYMETNKCTYKGQYCKQRVRITYFDLI